MTSFLNFLIPRAAWLYIHFVMLTSKVTWLHRDREDAVKKQHGNYIFAWWHGRQVLLTWAYRNTGFATIVSQSKDGEYIARVLHHFGMTTSRGSSSRGGAKALVGLKRFMDQGLCVGFTPDGPKGPQRTVNPGVLFLAQKTGKPILPIAASFSRRKIFRGWDDYWIPFPFGLVVFALGNPVSVGPGDDFEQKRVELAKAIDQITAEADALTEAAR